MRPDSNDYLDKNRAVLCGEVVSGFEYDHRFGSEKFYRMYLMCPRRSGEFDTIPVIVSDRLIDVDCNFRGRYLRVAGQFRSFNKWIQGQRSKLLLFVFATEVSNLETLPDSDECNQLYLDGFVCKETKLRRTPETKRSICDMLLAVNRNYDKSDYIPCILWGRNAYYGRDRIKGDRCIVTGRMQSRIYEKRYDDGSSESMIAYEVSVREVLDIPENEAADNRPAEQEQEV